MKTVTQIRVLLEEKTLADGQLDQLRADSRRSVQQLLKRYDRVLEKERRLEEHAAAMVKYEQRYWGAGVECVVGIDEVGVGPLAGPVVAAAVVFPLGTKIAGVDDSKKLNDARRRELAVAIRARATAWAIGKCENEEIDRLNIFQAAQEAMRRAVHALGVEPGVVLVDGRGLQQCPWRQEAIAKGDQKSLSIAAASILAKLERDAAMDQLAGVHPHYGFERHKGYGTAEHLAALRKYGPSPLHRQSFEPVRQASQQRRLDL